MSDGSIEIMLGKLEERSVRTLSAVEHLGDDVNKIREEITVLKIGQKNIQWASDIEDAKIRGMINANSIKTSGLTTVVIMIVQYIFTNLK